MPHSVRLHGPLTCARILSNSIRVESIQYENLNAKPKSDLEYEHESCIIQRVVVYQQLLTSPFPRYHLHAAALT
ncbi:hypothetical protein J6590_090609 [Homalodisca vitripennis]|nr:hypothetical protein J6590_090609 [Homalodisca vitripennis]